jgi:hypothetical protein
MARAPLHVAVAAALAAAALAPTVAHAQKEPTGPHPRILLDDDLRAAWKKAAKQKGSAVAAAITACDELTANPNQYKRDLYMGLDWARYLQQCLVAWVATGKDGHAKTVLRYFTAMIDDLDNVGDGKGGDKAAWRDSGFAMRAMGPYTALAYDWLHDHPQMTDELKARARQRFASWTDWYKDNGYRARNPGNNYQAGYLIGATFIALAQAGDAGRAGTRLWGHVVDDLWNGDMATALAPGGVLDGGDWGEGWQYGPLSVAEYAITARALAPHGVAVEGMDRWLEALAIRNIHGLSPGDEFFVGGDTQIDSANLAPPYLSFAAPLIGDAGPDVWAWAKDELIELGLRPKDWPLYEALAEARAVERKPVPRESWPTTFLARGIGTFYARSEWGPDGVWMVMQCTKTVDVDHMPANAGNFVVSRGRDDVIVDPSPYGSLSSLSSNAPTVESAHLPEDYKPGQAYWSEKTRYVWARQTESGIIAARCDYADQYKFQHRPSDVPEAVRDVVLVPYGGGDDAAVVVVDRARSGEKGRELFLRFNVDGKLALSGDVATGKVGGTQVTVRRVTSTSGKPEARSKKKGDCFGASTTRGNCDIPRFDVDEYRLIVDGPEMSALHVIDLAGPAKAAPTVTPIAGVDGVVLERDGRRAVVVAAKPGAKEIGYEAPRGAGTYHVVVGAPESGGKAGVTATQSGGACKVTVKASGGVAVDARPVVVVLDDACAVTEDPTQKKPLPGTGRVGGGPGTDVDAGAVGGGAPDGGGAPGGGDGTASGGDGAPGGPTPPTSARSGCCGAQAAPGSAAAMTVVVALGLCGLLRRRRSRT